MRKGWIKTTLGEVAKITSGFAFSTKSWTKEGIPVIKINNVRNGKVTTENCSYVKEPIPSGSEKFMLSKGDLLITLTGEIGAIGVVTQDYQMLLNQRVGRLDLKSKECIKEFLALFLSTENVRSEMWSYGKGNAQLNISPKSIESLELSLPPLQEQKRIVDLISSVDSYIDALQHQADSAGKSRNAVLHELLSAGGDGWTETTLGKIFSECKNGLNYKDGEVLQGLRVSRIQTIADGSINLEKVGFVEKNMYLESKFMLKSGDILFSHINSLAHVGKVAIVQDEHLPLIHGMNLLKMKFIFGISQEFMFYVMQSEVMREEIRSRAQKAVNQVSINIANIKGIRIFLPPLQEQKRIVDLISSMDDAISAAEVTIAETKKLRSGLLSDLLSGNHEIPASYDKIMGAA
jgi:type I restriction enzyme S subunit